LLQQYVVTKASVVAKTNFYAAEPSPDLCGGQKMAPHVHKWSPLDGAHE